MDIMSLNYLKRLEMAFKNIEQGKFLEAVKQYHKIKDLYDKLPNKTKENFKKKTNILFNELRLYLHINEANLFAEKGDAVGLKQALEIVDEIANYEVPQDLPSSQILLNYIKKKNFKCLIKCQSVLTLKDFQKRLTELDVLLINGEKEKAREEFSNLLVLLNRIPNLNKQTYNELHNVLQDVYKRLSYHILIKNAYKKRQNIEIKGSLRPEVKEYKDKELNILEKLRPKPPLNRNHPLYHLNEKIEKKIKASAFTHLQKNKEISLYNGFDQRYNEIIECIKHNDSKKAKQIFNSL